MADLPENSDMFGQFQTEHNMHRALWDDPDLGPALRAAGYAPNDISNRWNYGASLPIKRT
jgi:hypothetical protein